MGEKEKDRGESRGPVLFILLRGMGAGGVVGDIIYGAHTRSLHGTQRQGI